MPRDMLDLPLIGRAAEVRADTIDTDTRTIDVVWTTGATVQRVRWEGWDDRIEYDEELSVTPDALRLERLNAGAPFLDSHSSWRLTSVLGAVVPGSVRIEGGRGYAKVRLTDAADARTAVQRILDKSVRFVSVGYRVHRYEITKKDGARELWRAVDWEPMEISAVAMPADPGAHIRAADQAGLPLNRCAIIWRDIPAAVAASSAKEGDMPNENTPGGSTTAPVETRAAPVAGSPAAGSPAATAVPAAEVTRAAPAAPAADVLAAERQRSADILALCRRHNQPDLAERHIAGGSSLDQVRTAILDQMAGQDTAGRVAEPAPAEPRREDSRAPAWRGAVENALMHRVAPTTALTEAAREFRGMSLLELARGSLERSGVSTRGMSRMELAAAALGQRAVGYHATGDFPLVLANIGNHTLRAAYTAIPRTFTAWARRASLSDFRPTTRVQVSNAPQLLKVPEGAEFTYGTFGEASLQYALATYGRIIAFTRQMLINDDLGAFTRVSESFGARAAQLEADLVYAILTGNPTLSDGVALFHATHGNLGTAAVISEASLVEAYLAYAQQTDIDGTAIDVAPQFIIVPPGQRELEARKILTATTPDKAADVNTFSNRLSVISERRLLPSAGQAPWFLASPSSMIDTVEYAYLDGQEGIFTESRNGFEVDGVEIKARLDFAASAIDHRGLFKNPGAAPA